MIGANLRAQRQRLGATPQQVAELAHVRTDELEQWESVGVIPRKHRAAVDLALWQLGCDAALEASGLPRCEWLTEAEANPWEFDPEQLIAHVEVCSVCRERREYVDAHVRPRPLTGSLLMRLLGFGERLNGWWKSAFVGSVLLLTMGGMGVPILLGMGILRRDLHLVAAAFGLLFVLIVSGAAGGVVHYASTPLRSKGAIGYYASWTLAVYGYMVAAGGLIALGLQAAGEDVFGRAATMLSEPEGWITLLAVFAMGIVFGVAAGRGARRREPRDMEAHPARRLFSIQNIALAVLLILGVGVRLLPKLEGPSTRAEWEAALPGLQTDAQKHPDDADAQRQLAWALVTLDHWKDALPALQRAVRLNPEDADLVNSLGWATLQDGKPEAALPLFQSAVHLNPTYEIAQHNIGWTLFRLGRLNEAVPAYRRAIALDSTVAGTHGELGWALLGLHRVEEAEEQLRQAVELDSTSGWYRQGLATAEMKSGHLDQALKDFRITTRLSPKSADSWADLGHLAHMMGKYDESSTAFASADRLDPSYFARNPYRRGMWEASEERRPYRGDVE